MQRKKKTNGKLLKAPFPWFGGKSRVADLVWSRFGDVSNYVEPFAGSLAVLLGRPHEAHTETVNDKDCYLANFWRALAADPEGVVLWADTPVNEADLHARHTWLVDQDAFIELMKLDPDYFDVKIAGWWVWGICCWIGSGWCTSAASRKLPSISDTGMDVYRKRPKIASGGLGVHRTNSGGLLEYMEALSVRLRRVRVCCGDWLRVLSPSSTVHIGLTGVFLDPPYGTAGGRDKWLYNEDDLELSVAVRDWALAHGDNAKLHIALCGYKGEHNMPADWECVAWKSSGGHSTQREDEQVWFSPGCLTPSKYQPLFDPTI